MPEDPFNPVYQQLRLKMETKKIKVISQQQACHQDTSFIPQITILEHEFTERPFAYAADGQVQREKILFQMKYEYKQGNQTHTDIIKLQRFWQINLNQNLANMAEKEMIEREMIVDCVQQLLVQLTAL